MNKEKITLINEKLIGQGNTDVIAEVFTTNYVAHADGKDYKGHEPIKRWVKQLRSALPDIKVLKVEYFIQEGQTSVWQRTLSGTFKEKMLGIPASKKKVKWTESVITRFEGKKIVEAWVVSELAGKLLLSLPKKK